MAVPRVSISPAAVMVFRQELGLAVDLDDFEISQLFPSGQDFSADSKLAAITKTPESSAGPDHGKKNAKEVDGAPTTTPTHPG